MASVAAHEEGELVAPDVDEAAATNFQHVFLPTKRLHVVGFRVPHYQSERPVKPEKLVSYWRQFTRAALGIASQKVVLIGDFNVGNGKVRMLRGRRHPEAREGGVSDVRRGGRAGSGAGESARSRCSRSR